MHDGNHTGGLLVVVLGQSQSAIAHSQVAGARADRHTGCNVVAVGHVVDHAVEHVVEHAVDHVVDRRSAHKDYQKVRDAVQEAVLHNHSHSQVAVRHTGVVHRSVNHMDWVHIRSCFFRPSLSHRAARKDGCCHTHHILKRADACCHFHGR